MYVLVFKMSINNGTVTCNTRTGAESSLQWAGYTTVRAHTRRDKSTASFQREPARIINIRLGRTLQMSPTHKFRTTLCPSVPIYLLEVMPCKINCFPAMCGAQTSANNLTGSIVFLCTRAICKKEKKTHKLLLFIGFGLFFVKWQTLLKNKSI